jgi:hypothetical protein
VDSLAALISAALLGGGSMATAIGGLILQSRRGDAETRKEVKKLRRDLINAEAAIFRLKSILARHGLMSEYELEHGDEEPGNEDEGDDDAA